MPPLNLRSFQFNPDDSSILVFLPGQQPQLLQGNDSLPVLDGIELELTASQVFSWLKMVSSWF
ncbi:MAG: hypothetical protein QNJ32_13150 [Xenococcaceae cyanobacterium MO_167.B27]|nr:hypothetical protein [Xenococcaceae cyanobacterium MO_167.B27]